MSKTIDPFNLRPRPLDISINIAAAAAYSMAAQAKMNQIMSSDASKQAKALAAADAIIKAQETMTRIINETN